MGEKKEEYKGQQWKLTIEGRRVTAKPIVTEIQKGVYQKEYTPHGIQVMRGHLRGDDAEYLDAVGRRIFVECSKPPKKPKKSKD